MISSDRDSPLSPELVSSMSLEDALRALGLDHAAANLETAQQKAIARNDSPDVPFEQSINAYRGCTHACVKPGLLLR